MKRDKLLQGFIYSTVIAVLFVGCESGSNPIPSTQNSATQKNDKFNDDLQKQLDELTEQLNEVEKDGTNIELIAVQDKIEDIKKQIDDAMEIAYEYKHPINLKHSNPVKKIGNKGWMIVRYDNVIEDESTSETDLFIAKQSWSDANDFCKNFESMSGEKGWKLPSKIDIVDINETSTDDKLVIGEIFEGNNTFPQDEKNVALWLDAKNISAQIPNYEQNPDAGKPNLDHKSSDDQKFLFTCVKYMPDTL